MGTCFSATCNETIQHPILGSAQECVLMDKKLLKMINCSLTEVQFKEWEKIFKAIQQGNSHLRKVLFLPVFYEKVEICGLGTCIEFYFQNYQQNIAGYFKTYNKNLCEEKIKNIGSALFQLLDICPDLDEEVTWEKILENEEGSIKIALKKYLPSFENLEFSTSQRPISSQKLFGDTQYSISPRNLHKRNELKQINLFSSICQIILSLGKNRSSFSSSFQSILNKMNEKNIETVKNYFLDRKPKNPTNFFLQKSIIENMNEKSQDISLFLVSESGYANSFYT